MDKPNFSRRDFLSAGSVLGASAVVPSVTYNSGIISTEKTRGMLNVLDFG